MRVAVISDTHDNIANILFALKCVQDAGIHILIHCGDVCSRDTLWKISENFSGDIYLSCGNNDDYHKFLEGGHGDRLKIFEDFGEAEIFKRKIAFCHYPDRAEALAKTGGYDAVFYGHDHRPWERHIHSAHLLNPGTLAGLFSRPTYALYDLKSLKGELKIIFEMGSK